MRRGFTGKSHIASYMVCSYNNCIFDVVLFCRLTFIMLVECFKANARSVVVRFIHLWERAIDTNAAKH